MAKRKRQMDQAKIERWRAAGRGQGAGPNYKPWLRIQDVASQGRRHRIKGIKTQGRIHHYMSDLERKYHYVLEAAPNVADIREQWPLNLEATIAIAAELGIKHPTDPKTQEPVVMTTDFFITVATDCGDEYLARTIKMSQDLTKRVMEKLEIERLYFEIQGISWGVVTERDIPEVVVKNMELLFKYQSLEDYPVTERDVQNVVQVLTPRLVAREGSLGDLALNCDEQLGLNPGSSLTIVYHLLCNQVWKVDLSQPLKADERLSLLASGLGEQKAGQAA